MILLSKSYTNLFSSSFLCLFSMSFTRFASSLASLFRRYPYVGNLECPFAKVKHALKEGGYFCFSTEEWRTESKEDDKNDALSTAGYKINTTGRYLHKKQYLQHVAEKCGFQILVLQSAVLRKNAGKEVQGLIGVLRLPIVKPIVKMVNM